MNPEIDREGATPTEGSAAGGTVTVRTEHLATLLGERMYRFAGLLFLLALVFRYFEPVSHVLLIAFVGAILGMAFNAVVVRIPLRRGVATILLALALLSTIGVVVWLGISAVVGQLRQLVEDLPGILERLEAWEAQFQQATGLQFELLGPRAEQIVRQVVGGVDGAAVLTRTFGVLELVAISVLVLVGAFFIVAEPNRQLLIPLFRTVPRRRRPAFRRMFTRLGDRLSGWLLGTLISMFLIGGLSVIAFYLLGVPYPLILGILIGLFDIVPLIGPWIGGAIAVLVTLLHDPGLALWVALTVLVIQEVEGNVIRPLVMSESAKVHPFVTLLALLLFGSIFGLLGAILALPIVLAIGTVVEVLWVEESLDAGDDEIEPPVKV